MAMEMTEEAGYSTGLAIKALAAGWKIWMGGQWR